MVWFASESRPEPDAMGRSAADCTATYDACQIHRAQVGRVIGQGRQRLVPCPPRAHADDPPSTPDEMPAVVREGKGFDVAEARPVRADTATGDTVFDVVEGVALYASLSARHRRLPLSGRFRSHTTLRRPS